MFYLIILSVKDKCFVLKTNALCVRQTIGMSTLVLYKLHNSTVI